MFISNFLSSRFVQLLVRNHTIEKIVSDIYQYSFNYIFEIIFVQYRINITFLILLCACVYAPLSCKTCPIILYQKATSACIINIITD